MATENDVLIVLELLQDAFPHVRMREGTPEIYARLLADIPPDVLRDAAEKCIYRSQFFPTIAQLREAALGFSNEPYNPHPGMTEEEYQQSLADFQKWQAEHAQSR